jgi:primase-polymerase (primpol)-like protein
MGSRACAHCFEPINTLRSDARFCSAKCRVYANRAIIPAELKALNRWVRWAPVTRNGRIDKVPVTTAGRNASSTNPSTWTDYATAKASGVGVGLGFVLNGDGVSCIDLDHCVTDGKPNAKAKAFMERFPGAWVELSPSGDGLHIWGTAPAGPGRRTSIDGLDVEFYATGRYITVTGRTVRAGNLQQPLHL